MILDRDNRRDRIFRQKPCVLHRFSENSLLVKVADLYARHLYQSNRDKEITETHSEFWRKSVNDGLSLMPDLYENTVPDLCKMPSRR